MRPRLKLMNGEWFCIGMRVVAKGDTFHAAYQRWYQLRCIEG